MKPVVKRYATLSFTSHNVPRFGGYAPNRTSRNWVGMRLISSTIGTLASAARNPAASGRNSTARFTTSNTALRLRSRKRRAQRPRIQRLPARISLPSAYETKLKRCGMTVRPIYGAEYPCPKAAREFGMCRQHAEVTAKKLAKIGL